MAWSELRSVIDGQVTGGAASELRRIAPTRPLAVPRRILALTNMLPYPPTNGGQMRDWEMLRAFTSMGCEINLLSFDQLEGANGQREEVRRVCKTIEVVSRSMASLSNSRDYLARFRALPTSLPYAVARFQDEAMQQRIAQWTQSGRVDAVLSNTPFPLANLPSTVPVPLIVNCHNVEHLILRRYLQCERNHLRRAYAWVECQKLERWEKEVCSKASLLLVCSEHDQSVMKKLCPGPSVAVVPNAIDVNQYAPSDRSDGATLLYTGGMDWFPNRDAVEFFVTTILPELRRMVPQIKFVVAGRRGPEKFHQKLSKIPNVEFHGPVTDMRAEIAGAAVCVVPLRMGSGTRLKILEAAAMGKPVVSTRIGAEGLNFAEGKEILLADRPVEFACLVADLLSDSKHRSALGQAARCSVEKQYSVSSLRLALLEGLQSWPQKRSCPNTRSTHCPAGEDEKKA